ncbi:hypothetical protein FOPE_03620 [Fonsecaea pedrosoi]|nr:hypothetical protein FOPE_03620 [Fonsecaea pedrosoi]
MDRFTRTREHYLRGTHRDCPSETPSAPSVADLAFDFDFLDSKLDLSFDVGSPVVRDDSKTSSLSPSDTNEGIGMALSDGLPYQRREHLDHLATREDGHNCGQRQNECISSGPIDPNETRIKFSGRCERPAKNLPPCSIYSREWRKRVRLTAAPREETSDHVSAEHANPSLKETSSDTTRPAPPQQVNWDDTDQESVPVPAPGPKDVHKTNEGWPFPANTSLPADGKKHRKLFPLLRKWLLRPKKHSDKKATLSSADAGVEKVPLDTNTSCATSLHDTPNPQPFPRIGNALRKRVAQKQAEAQDQISLPRRRTGSLRGGGNLNSIQKGRQWDNDQGAHNRRRCGADRHESSGSIAVHNNFVMFTEDEECLDNIQPPHLFPNWPVRCQPRHPRFPRDQPQNRNQHGTDGFRPPTQTRPDNSQTSTQVQRRPDHGTPRHENDRRGPRPGRQIRGSVIQSAGRRPQKPGHEASHPTPPCQADYATPRELSEECIRSPTSPSHSPRPAHTSIPPNHPCSLRSATSGPPTERIKGSETVDAPSQNTPSTGGTWNENGNGNANAQAKTETETETERETEPTWSFGNLGL